MNSFAKTLVVLNHLPSIFQDYA